MGEQLPFLVEQDHPEVLTIRMTADSPSWSQWFLIRSDSHHDSKHCDQALEKQHLEEARARSAGILDLGDLFDAMGGKGDRRFDEDELPDDLRATRKTYFDSLIRYAADFYTPYARNWCLLGLGNHEDSVLTFYSTSLTERLAEKLRAEGSPVKTGPYQGFVRFMFTFSTTHRQSYKLWWHHGSGGSAPVTKGVIASNRQVVFLDDVDLIACGHLHTAYHVEYRRSGLSPEGRPYLKDIDVIRVPGYKDSFSGGKGWAVKKGFGPEPLGAWWLHFTYQNRQIRHELTRAK